jgi:hypothetical protein
MFLEKRDFITSLNFCRGMLCLRVSAQHGPRGRNMTGLQHKNEENPSEFQVNSSETKSIHVNPNQTK